MDLRDKHAIITGGASGIGAACAREFSRLGARVVVADRNGDGARQVADEIGGMAVACDVGDESDVNALVAKSERAYGPVDVFFSNAGIATGGNPLDTDIDTWNEQWQVNLMAHVFAVRAVLPWVIGIGGVLIILVAAGWTAWRFLLATPKDVRSTYRRLRRLGRFAALAPAPHQTPHQWAATVLQALPEQRSEVLRIVDAYTLSAYSGRTFDESAGDGDNDVADAWNTVRFPLLWYALRRREA